MYDGESVTNAIEIKLKNTSVEHVSGSLMLSANKLFSLLVNIYVGKRAAWRQYFLIADKIEQE